MEVIDGGWVLKGIDGDESACLHSVEEAEKLIGEIGFLPLFHNEIEGFSLEERTDSSFWWSDTPQKDPWEWRAVIARRHSIMYGKVFNKKAGFVATDWIPYFANFRRDGYDFDALYDDGLAPIKNKKIMDNFMDENEGSCIMSNILKAQSGFGKDGLKGFDGAISALMMQTYLCNSDFKKRLNKKGMEFGWDVAEYTMPETVWGRDYVTKAYSETPEESYKRIVAQLKKHFPSATDKQIEKVLKR